MPKLHIPGPASQLTACGRQLNNHRDTRAQDATNAVLAQSIDQYLEALHKGNACRHCGRAGGLVARIIRAQPNGDDTEDAGE